MGANCSIVRKKQCAIYTRKSAQAPVAQELTSLESQRAICSSYIASQQHKDWSELSKSYDDAGRTGSNLQRPALQDLLADIELGLVDVVLVYKLDRITRTLLDFVRLIDFFDRHGVVFVAITQNFDTSDSMGRLIRNVLLTFAQFEREIASDRMRDKKMVMKQRGLWTGGDAPVGYDLRRGKLVVNSQEALVVRCIFETYVATKRLAAVHRELLRQGFRRKVWKSKNGVSHGGKAIALSTLHHVLGNPVYIGEVTHRGDRYQGIHEAIVDRGLWELAQEVLEERRMFKPHQPSRLLTGILYDAHGRRMHAREGKGTWGSFRYYASAPVVWAVRQNIRPVRARGLQLEQLVVESLKALLADRVQLRLLLTQAGIYGPELDQLSKRGSESAVRMDRGTVRQLSCALKALLQRVEVHSEFVRLIVRTEALAPFLAWDGFGLFVLNTLELARARQIHVIDIEAAVDRQRTKHCLPIGPCRGSAGKVDSALISLLEDARHAQRLVFDNRDVPVPDLAYSLGRKPAHFARLVRLNYLAPDIIAAILDGGQPEGVTRKTLMQLDLPTDWGLQRRLLGFPPRHQEPVDSATA
jgi:DNA invertase Pin-like site-specific DNA recombinase